VGGRDLLQRRGTATQQQGQAVNMGAEAGGTSTVWLDSPLIEAARHGGELDGML
jgi:hypothetical protein